MRLRERDFAAFGSVEQDALAPAPVRNSVAGTTQATRSKRLRATPAARAHPATMVIATFRRKSKGQTVERLGKRDRATRVTEQQSG